MSNLKRIEGTIERKKRQIELLKKEIITLEGFKRQYFFSMMNGKGVY